MDSLNSYNGLFVHGWGLDTVHALKVINNAENGITDTVQTMSAAPEDYTEYDWFGQARIRETNDDLEGAVEAYDEAIKLNPKFAKAHYYKALAYYQLGEMDKAKEAAKRALDLKPSWKEHVTENMPQLEF